MEEKLMLWGVGMLLGGIGLSLWKKNFNKVIAINVSNILCGFLLGWSGFLSPEYFMLFVFLMLACGAAYAIENSCFMAILQEKINQKTLARVISFYYSLVTLISVIGLVFSGRVADAIGVNLTFMILGICAGLVGLVSFMFPAMTRIDKNIGKETK